MDFARSFREGASSPDPNRIAPTSLFPLLLLFLFLPATLSAQEASVQGTVTESGGEPVVGAQVSVRGTNQGAVTDRDGRYVIGGLPAETEVRLRVVYLGFLDAHRTVDLEEGVNTADFVLNPSPIELDKIVVTGVAGNVQRRSVGNAISDINAGEILEKAPTVSNMTDLLKGRSAGVSVLPSGGDVGSGAAIRLRGLSSITQGNEPLVFIDGVGIDSSPEGTGAQGDIYVGGQSPSRINDLIAEDIESIEIIKGPAASTLYGTDAASGVINIITKKGVSGDLRWNIKTQWGRVDLENGEYADNFARVPSADAIPSCFPITIGDKEIGEGACGIRTVKTLDDGSVIIAQNPIESILDDGFVQDYTLNVSGGQENFTFFASGKIQDDKGALPVNFVKKKSGRANFQWSPGAEGVFDLAVSSGFTNGAFALPVNANNIFGFFGNAILSRPDFIRPPNFTFGEFFTALDDVEAQETEWTNDRFTGSVTANFNPFDWVSNKATFGIDVNAEENFQFIPFGQLTNLEPRGAKDNIRSTVVNLTFDYNGTVSWPLTDALRSNSSAGVQIFNRNDDTVIATGREFPAPGVSTVSAAAITEGFETRQENTTFGFYVQEQLAWQNRLFLTAAVRGDENSAFGEAFEREYFPKVSAAWVINEEPWFAIPGISTLKLRTAWGKAGKTPQGGDIFASQRTFSAVSVKGGVPTVTPNEVGNPDLGPEESGEIEVGFDASLWNDRFTVEYTYYDKSTKDALVNRPNIPSEGFPGSQLFNIGEVDNSGHELGINGLVLDTTPLDVDFNFSLSTNENEVVDLGGAPDFAIGFGQRVDEGFPLGGYFSRVIVGRDAEGNPEFSDDREFLGRNTPGWWGSFGSTVTLWDNLRVYSLFDFQRDYKLLNFSDEFRYSFTQNTIEFHDPAFEDDQEFQDKLAFIAIGHDAPWVEDADFVKFRELSISYILPRDWARQIRADRAVFTFSGRNLATWTDYTGMDPEVSWEGQQSLSRADFLQPPPGRRFIASINLTL